MLLFMVVDAARLKRHIPLLPGVVRTEGRVIAVTVSYMVFTDLGAQIIEFLKLSNPHGYHLCVCVCVCGCQKILKLFRVYSTLERFVGWL